MSTEPISARPSCLDGALHIAPACMVRRPARLNTRVLRARADEPATDYRPHPAPGLARYRDHRPRRAVFDCAGRLRPAAGLCLAPRRRGDPAPVDFSLEYVRHAPAALLEKLNQWLAPSTASTPSSARNLVQFDLRVSAGPRGAASRCRCGWPGRRERWSGTACRGSAAPFAAAAAGRLIIDGIEALRGATWSFPSFSLRVGGPDPAAAARRSTTRTTAWTPSTACSPRTPALARYNLRDCELVTRIFAATELLTFLLERATVTGLPTDRSGGSVAAFTHLIAPLMHRGGLRGAESGRTGAEASLGGFVMDSRPGLYESVLVLDYKSLYPSIIRTFRDRSDWAAEGWPTPTTPIRCPVSGRAVLARQAPPAGHRRADPAGPGGGQARAEQAALAGAEDHHERVHGVLGSSGCRFFDPRLASSIAMRTRSCARCACWIEARGYDGIYGDIITLVTRCAPCRRRRGTSSARTRRLTVNDWWRDHLRDLRPGQALWNLRSRPLPARCRIAPTILKQPNWAASAGRQCSARSRWPPRWCTRGRSWCARFGRLLARCSSGISATAMSTACRTAALCAWTSCAARRPANCCTKRGESPGLTRKRLRRQLGVYRLYPSPHLRRARCADHLRNEAMPLQVPTRS